MAKTARQYQQEIEDLQARLQEAEETLEAIRTGQVDAVVVTQDQQEQVFTLQGAEHAYRVILEKMNEGAAMLAADGTIVYCNARFAEALGQPLDQVLGRPIEPYVLPGDRTAFQALFQQAVQDDSRGEVRFQGHNGAAVPMYLSLNPLFLDQAASICMVATDLSEQKRHEQVLAAEELARSILEQAAEPMVVCDGGGTIIRASQAAQELCGRNPTKQSFYKAFPLRPAERKDLLVNPPGGARDSLCLEEIAAGKACHGVEMTLKCEEGRILNLLVSGRPLLGRQNEVLGSVISLTNITRRKQAEQALRESEQRYRLLFDRNPDGVFTIDEAGRVILVNPACEVISGFSAPELLQKMFMEICAPDQLPKALEYFERCTRQATYQQFETALIRKDGQRVELWVAGEPILSDDHVVAVHCTAKDITERKQVEQQLQELNATLEQRVAERTAELEQRAAQLRAMTTDLTLAEHRERQRIAKVLHDHLQQLLVGAKFHIATVLSRIAQPEIRRSLDLVNGLLDDSVQSSRSLTAELFPPALREGTFADALRWLIQWMRDKHDLQVHFKVDEQADPQVEEIRLLLFEAARELLFNVVKHAGVREACLEAIRHNGEQIRLTVADSGRGFDVASVRPANRSEGGFGLSTIQERLHSLGGRVEIESTPGRGTRATLIAPLRL